MESAPGSDATTCRSRGISSAVGFVIVVTIILASVVVIVGLGSTALGETMDRSEQNLAEHTMTLFDSRAAMVALGSSDSQSLNFNLQSGTVETRPDAGSLTIKHIDYRAGNTQTIFEEPLGALVYTNGDTEVAYQGGGVWRRDDGADARMLSPPEFHYRGSTLTLPVVRVTGDRTSATSPVVTVRDGDTTRIFPSDDTYDVTGDTYDNPIQNGSVVIEVTSPFYEGWASYARQRTSARVSSFDSNETVRLELESLAGSPGEFGVPLEGDSLEVGGLKGNHSISDFTLSLKADGNFQNAHWSLYSTDNGNEFEMHVWSRSQCSGDSYDGEIHYSLYFHDSSGVTQEWNNTALTPGPEQAFEVDCENEELLVNFTNENTQLTYGEIVTQGSNNKWCFGEHIEEQDVPESVTFTEHGADPDTSFAKGSGTASMNLTVNHYMSRMGTDYELTVTDGSGNSECLSTGSGEGSSNVDESASSGRLEYAESEEAKFLTYLHVTENHIRISLD